MELQVQEPWDLVEFFSGRTKIARIATKSGYKAAGVDLNFDAARAASRRNRLNKTSPFDLNSDSGFAHLCLYGNSSVLLGIA